MAAPNPNSDSIVQGTDGMGDLSCVRFSPSVSPQLLAAVGWGNVARCWEVVPSGNNAVGAQARAETKLDRPILSCSWKTDNQSVFLGCADNTVRMWNLAQPQSPPQTIGQHQAAVRHVVWAPDQNVLCSGGLDKALCFWDLRSNQPAARVDLGHQCFAMDLAAGMLAVGTSNQEVLLFNLASPNPSAVVETIRTQPLKYQTRCVACFPDQAGVAVGSVEGRVAIKMRAPNDAQSFAFKCHRQNTNSNSVSATFPVNAMCFHPIHGTFATAGGDGSVCFWDKENKQKVKGLEAVGQPIVSCHFNANGSLFAYAASYDWAKGHTGVTGKQPVVYVRVPPPADVEKRKKR